MGKRGPPATPLKVLQARGSWRGKPKPGQPSPVDGEFVKPDWLGPIASAKWDEMVPLLRQKGCEAPDYSDFLAIYCEAHQEVHDAMEVIAKEGMLCVSEKGATYQHPAVGIK